MQVLGEGLKERTADTRFPAGGNGAPSGGRFWRHRVGGPLRRAG